MAVNPLAPNCQAYSVDATGKVTGVKLSVTPVTGSIYEVAKVELIPETEAQGQTVAFCSVIDETGVPLSIPVRLAWELVPGTSTFNFSTPPGNLENKHIITNAFDPIAKVGPLSLFPGIDNIAKLGDFVSGLGLPSGHHVSFRATWRKKGVVDPSTDTRIKALEAWAKAISLQYPGGPQYVG
jgi:hypothetical protein